MAAGHSPTVTCTLVAGRKNHLLGSSKGLIFRNFMRSISIFTSDLDYVCEVGAYNCRTAKNSMACIREYIRSQEKTNWKYCQGQNSGKNYNIYIYINYNIICK